MMRSRLARSLALSILCFALYIIYTGSTRIYDVVTGIVVSLIVGLALGPLIVEDWRKSLDIRRLGKLVAFTTKYFLVHETRAHLDFIARGLGLRPMKPRIVCLEPATKSGFGLTALSIAITNTPGTAVIDVYEDRGEICVHWVAAGDLPREEVYRAVVESFDRELKEVFD